MYMSISSRSGAMRFQRLLRIKYYYNVLKWESRFNLGFNAAKIINYIKKWFKPKLI